MATSRRSLHTFVDRLAKSALNSAARKTQSSVSCWDLPTGTDYGKLYAHDSAAGFRAEVEARTRMGLAVKGRRELEVYLFE
jgi:hypothetical protein